MVRLFVSYVTLSGSDIKNVGNAVVELENDKFESNKLATIIETILNKNLSITETEKTIIMSISVL